MSAKHLSPVSGNTEKTELQQVRQEDGFQIVKIVPKKLPPTANPVERKFMGRKIDRLDD